MLLSMDKKAVTGLFVVTAVDNQFKGGVFRLSCLQKPDQWTKLMHKMDGTTGYPYVPLRKILDMCV